LAVVKKKIQPAFKRIGIHGEGWHTFRHAVRTTPAEMGQYHLTIRGLPAAQQPACHQQELAGDLKGQAPGAEQVGRCHPVHGLVARAKANPMKVDPTKVGGEQIRGGEVAVCCYRPLISPDRGFCAAANAARWGTRNNGVDTLLRE
jgi:hypothetical protein